MLLDLAKLPSDEAVFDVVVIGAGGAGMAAALAAAIEGARVLLVERTAHVGGTTAFSAGTTWVPNTSHAAEVGAADDMATAERYLANAVGDRTPASLRRAFLERGPSVIADLEARTALRFRAYPLHPDYLGALEGAAVNGRALEPVPFDGRELGALFPLVRPPIPEFTVLGGMMVDRTDIFHLLRLTKSFASFRHGARLLLRHAIDRLRHPRGTRLVLGNALVGRLLHSLAQRRDVTLAMRTRVEDIVPERGGGHALTLVQDATRRTVRARGGIVIATGGFNRHPARRAALLPGADFAWCPGAPGHTGDMHVIVERLGGRYGAGVLSPAFWAPVSMRTRSDGTTAVFPHFILDRGKPGTLAVDPQGRRFVDETTSYHLFALAMQQATPVRAVPAWLLADARALRHYGLGMVRPGTKRLDPFLADGYLVRGDTLAELAARLGVDPATLEATVARFNALAKSGSDDDFRRGRTPYARNLGDPAWPGPNPTLGVLEEAPYYAVRLHPGDIGAATGFVTDAAGRVLDARDAPVPGLYAVGNDMHSIMGGVYPAPGITIGPGLVFGTLAGRDAAHRAGCHGPAGDGRIARRSDASAASSRR